VSGGVSGAPYDQALAGGPPARAHWLRTADGVRIRAAVWGEGASTVVILPGWTEYVEKYGRLAGDLVAAGHRVVALDWRGQGRSDRALAEAGRSHVGDFAEYQRDLEAVMHLIADLPGPRYMLAHSMGGCIGLRALTRGMGFARVVFSAPMWGVPVLAWQRPLAAVLPRVAERLGIQHWLAPGTGRENIVAQGVFEANRLTTDASQWAWMVEQARADAAFALGGPSIAFAGAALAEVAALERLEAPPLPCLTGMGTDERVVDPKAIPARMARWPGGVLHVAQGARHELLMEAEAYRAPFLAKILAHFQG
jgi:lysophospholipase